MHTICRRVATRALLAAVVVGAAWQLPVQPAVALGQPPSRPTLLSPPAGWVFPRLAPQVFSLISSDQDLEPYTAVVTVRFAATGAVARQFLTTPAPSSVKSTGTPVPPLDAGAYTWSAHAVDPTGGTSPESGSSSFRVEASPTTGGGDLQLAFTYDGGGVSHGSCTPITFDVGGQSTAAVVNLSLVGFVGPVVITGEGGSLCENGDFGEGALALTLTGTGPTGSTLSCPNLVGTYVRAAAAIVLQLEGACAVNQFDVLVSYTAVAGFSPTEPGGGVTVPFHRANAAGAFTVVPK